MKDNMYLGAYPDLVQGFLNQGYEVVNFQSLSQASGQLILRHDIDFDCECAYQLSRLETALGVRATYFFMLRSDSYNLLSPHNSDWVKRIRDDGHMVSLHFDPTIYDDFRAGLHEERRVFEAMFGEPVKIISLHRPSSFFLEFDTTIDGIEHTYQTKYAKAIKYVSDSRGEFRFGHPFQTAEFRARRSIQLLIHPIWWIMGASSNIETLKDFASHRQRQFDLHIAKNCLPYRQVVGGL